MSVRANGLVDSVSARKFLEAADKTGDKRVFFTVFRLDWKTKYLCEIHILIEVIIICVKLSLFSFFEERNLRMRGSGKFRWR